ncbi:MAG TPA: hypothetical protein VGG64_08880 [Pirellulales bacterium]|jgi:hypothetical protein
MRSFLLAVVAIVGVALIAGESQARVFGNRGNMVCNNNQAAGPVKAKQVDLSQTVAPRVLQAAPEAAPQIVLAPKSKSGVDLASLARLNERTTVEGAELVASK